MTHVNDKEGVMADLDEYRCTTPRCIRAVERYGERYRRIVPLSLPAPDFMPDAVAKCEGCGGYTNGEAWMHVCQECGRQVEPGELVGLFVPHLCQECLDKLVEWQRKTGRVCRMCHQPYALCCC